VTHVLLVGLGPQEILLILVVALLSLAFWALMLWGVVQLVAPLFRRRRPHDGEASQPQQQH
jgi:hypothetical protein